MPFNHTFKTQVNWTLSEGETTTNPRSFSRNHTVHIVDKKQDLEVSAAKPFRGDERLHNPEDLLLSAIASCHMMSYLYVCSQNNIEVLEYSDHAEGILEVQSTGSGSFTKVILSPVVTIKNSAQKELALKLHEKANALCFIANSCNFPITHQAKVIIV
ncbi:OsmC family protein [Tamlana sp. 2_MG-2023]|uniref:OsmC family protein n=1 Tax=unclassified Tamlana TaxID=2614803 RepID=UPI0026E28EB1|nr:MULTISPECIES: OsmC family protein [unclassified Tamlana]MDO6759270.1 OsmC family protein [Tamlana sp. 2_MG-2023]MDO6790591.1 OsmC family protein [Tamlana sp. 1_MG-2023]